MSRFDYVPRAHHGGCGGALHGGPGRRSRYHHHNQSPHVDQQLLYQLIKACSERGKAGGVGSLCLLHLRERSICGHLSVLKLTHLLVGDPNLLCQALHMLVHLAIKVVNDAFSAWGLRHGVLISWLP